MGARPDLAVEERGAEAVDGAGLETHTSASRIPRRRMAHVQPIAEKLRRRTPGLDISRTSPEDHRQRQAGRGGYPPNAEEDKRNRSR